MTLSAINSASFCVGNGPSTEVLQGATTRPATGHANRIECAMTLSERIELLFTGCISLIVTFLIFQYGQTMELHIIEYGQMFEKQRRLGLLNEAQKEDHPPIPIKVLYALTSYIIGSMCFFQAMKSLLDSVLGLAVVRIADLSVSKKTNCAKKYYQMYLNLFDIQNGKYLFQYLYAFELFEIILQYLSFNSLCADGNLQYIVLVLSLITINVMVSPILLVCSCSAKEYKLVHRPYN